MNPRINYEMTEADLEKILNACKPTPVMFLTGGKPMFDSPQENANRAWAELGKRMGFDPMSVQPIQNKGHRFFTAVPNETNEQRLERLNREAAVRREAEIEVLKLEIADRQERLARLQE